VTWKLQIALTFVMLHYGGRISSYKPGTDGHSGTRLAGARCLNLPEKFWDWKENYPVPVCAMRAGCSQGAVRMGDIATIKRKGFFHWCVILDSGPWGCLDADKSWHNCGPKTKYKGKLPPGWRWKSIVDVANPGKGYPGGGPGSVTVLHVQAKKAQRKQMILEMIK